MKKVLVNFVLLALLLSFLSCNENGNGMVENSPGGPEDETDSDYQFNPEEYNQKMQWFMDAKFGITIHWGPVTLSGVDISWGRYGYRDEFGEMPGYDPENMIPADEYDSLYRRFDPVEFDADKLMDIIENSGAKYFIFVTKHHDGFNMFDNPYSEYSIMNAPYGKDITKEIAKASEGRNIKTGWYYSLRDWHYPEYFTDKHSNYVEMLHANIEQLISDYGDPKIIWFDGRAAEANIWSTDVLRNKIYNLDPEIIINDRLIIYYSDYVTHEGYVPDYKKEYFEATISIGNQWSWSADQNIINSGEVIKTLCKAAGNNGNLLLNIMPDTLGIIGQKQLDALDGTGKWLDNYGEAIYGTTSGPYISEGSWAVSTMNDKVVYLIILKKQKDIIELPLLDNNELADHRVLTEDNIQINSSDSSLTIDLSSFDESRPLILKMKYKNDLKKYLYTKVEL